MTLYAYFLSICDILQQRIYTLSLSDVVPMHRITLMCESWEKNEMEWIYFSLCSDKKVNLMRHIVYKYSISKKKKTFKTHTHMYTLLHTTHFHTLTERKVSLWIQTRTILSRVANPTAKKGVVFLAFDTITIQLWELQALLFCMSGDVWACVWVKLFGFHFLQMWHCIQRRHFVCMRASVYVCVCLRFLSMAYDKC